MLHRPDKPMMLLMLKMLAGAATLCAQPYDPCAPHPSPSYYSVILGQLETSAKKLYGVEALSWIGMDSKFYSTFTDLENDATKVANREDCAKRMQTALMLWEEWYDRDAGLLYIPNELKDDAIVTHVAVAYVCVGKLTS